MLTTSIAEPTNSHLRTLLVRLSSPAPQEWLFLTPTPRISPAAQSLYAGRASLEPLLVAKTCPSPALKFNGKRRRRMSYGLPSNLSPLRTSNSTTPLLLTAELTCTEFAQRTFSAGANGPLLMSRYRLELDPRLLLPPRPPSSKRLRQETLPAKTSLPITKLRSTGKCLTRLT